MIQRDVSMRRLPDNTLAMDTAILAAVSSYEVGFNLMPGRVTVAGVSSRRWI
jgi:hypothetical protein